MGAEVAVGLGSVVAETAGEQAESMSEPARRAVSSIAMNLDCVLVNIIILHFFYLLDFLNNHIDADGSKIVSESGRTGVFGGYRKP